MFYVLTSRDSFKADLKSVNYQNTSGAINAVHPLLVEQLALVEGFWHTALGAHMPALAWRV